MMKTQRSAIDILLTQRGYSMKRYFLLFGSLIFLFSGQIAQAQEDDDPPPTGVWSVGFFTTFVSSISSSMHGELAQYESALSGGTTPAQYPFASRPYTIGFGLQADYRFVKSPLSLYLGGYGVGFNAGFGFRNSPGERFTMSILSTNGGIEYTFGQTYQHWNFYGRLGLVPSVITSSNRSGGGGRNNFFFTDSLRNNTVDSRLGMEIEIGERYHFSRLPIGIEASINYTNVNLFGKSYTTPNYSNGALFATPNNSINDGKNPSDPNDNARVIDYLQMRLGARYYF